jgi:hypothetical protein
VRATHTLYYIYTAHAGGGGRAGIYTAHAGGGGRAGRMEGKTKRDSAQERERGNARARASESG